MSDVDLILNPLTNAFNRAMSHATVADTNEDLITHLKSISILFAEVCNTAETYAAEKKETRKEVAELVEKSVEKEVKNCHYDDVVRGLHMILAIDHLAGSKAQIESCGGIFKQLRSMMEEDEKKIASLEVYEDLEKIETERNKRLVSHVNELAKKVVLQKMTARLFAKEVAALRQMMDLVRKAKTVDVAAKSNVWEQIEMENKNLRATILWLMNRINSWDRRDGSMAAGGEGCNFHASPRIVVLIRSHLYQGLGLEIKGGFQDQHPVVISAAMKGSMADDDQLHVGDRIVAVDGAFVSSTTSHSEVLQILENESTKDYLALVVSAFNPWFRKDLHDIDDSSDSGSVFDTSSSSFSE